MSFVNVTFMDGPKAGKTLAVIAVNGAPSPVVSVMVEPAEPVHRMFAPLAVGGDPDATYYRLDYYTYPVCHPNSWREGLIHHWEATTDRSKLP